MAEVYHSVPGFVCPYPLHSWTVVYDMSRYPSLSSSSSIGSHRLTPLGAPDESLVADVPTVSASLSSGKSVAEGGLEPHASSKASPHPSLSKSCG